MLLITIILIIFFILCKILNKDKFLLNKKNITLLYFLFEIEIYFFILKIIQLFLLFTFLITFFSLIFQIFIFISEFLVVETNCAGTQKLMVSQYDSSMVFYNYHKNNRIEIDSNQKYASLLNIYISDKRYADLSIFSIPYVKSVNSVYENKDNVLKILENIQVNILSITKINDKIIKSIMSISSADKINLIINNQLTLMLNDLKLANLQKISSIFFNYQKFGYPVFNELTNPTKIINILKYQLDLGEIYTSVLQFFPQKIPLDFDFSFLASETKYNSYYNYSFLITEAYIFLTNQNIKLDSCINFLNTNALTQDNKEFLIDFLNIALTPEPVLGSEKSQIMLDNYLSINNLESKNDSIDYNKLKIHFSIKKQLLFNEEPRINALYQNSKRIFLNNMKTDSTNTLKDILTQTRDLTINFNKLNRAVINPENAEFFDKKLLNRINVAKNYQTLTKKDYFKKYNS